MSTITITVSFKGASYSISVDEDSSLEQLQDEIELLTSVPTDLQKLLFKGKKAVLDETNTTLSDIGIKNGTKITLIGSMMKDIDTMRSSELESKRREDIIRQRRGAGPSKLSSTSRFSSNDITYRFHKISALQHLPNPSLAQGLLERLAADPAIKHVMKNHKFAVGLLTELAPHEHPGLLGLNVNAGQAIKLRLRTDAYDGLRLYNDVRRVLCHELSHNVHGDHDDDFKALNSLLNREVEAFERSARRGTYSLSGFAPGGDYYGSGDEMIESDTALHTNILGGSAVLSGGRDEMRANALAAAEKRRAKEEEEIEDKCGTN